MNTHFRVHKIKSKEYKPQGLSILTGYNKAAANFSPCRLFQNLHRLSKIALLSRNVFLISKKNCINSNSPSVKWFSIKFLHDPKAIKGETTQISGPLTYVVKYGKMFIWLNCLFKIISYYKTRFKLYQIQCFFNNYNLLL